jgi:HK97 gp10 family phage protein
MATSRTVSVSGLRELGETLKKLTTDMQSRASRRCTNAGAQVIKDACITAVEDPRAGKPYKVEGELVYPGNISRNIIVKRIPPAQSDLTSEHIVVVRGKSAHGFASRVGALQEYGTVKMPARPFMTPGFNHSKDHALTAMVISLTLDVEEGAKKAKA